MKGDFGGSRVTSRSANVLQEVRSIVHGSRTKVRGIQTAHVSACTIVEPIDHQLGDPGIVGVGMLALQLAAHLCDAFIGHLERAPQFRT
jgi:hypothetical protein